MKKAMGSSGGNSQDVDVGLDDENDPIASAELTENETKKKLQSAKPWLRMLDSYHRAFKRWHEIADETDKLYADLDDLASITRDRKFQLFWANTEVLKTSIYAQAPIPVVVSRFKDRRPLYSITSELMERCASVGFDLTDIDSVMKSIRDDVVIGGRGVMWGRYEKIKGEQKRVKLEHKHRNDFAHDVKRSWPEVEWVAAAAHVTKAEAKKRFSKHSGKEWEKLSFSVDKQGKEDGGTDTTVRAKVWEIWHKTQNIVVWVGEGCEKVLDEGEPHLDLQFGWPCPKPAYATLKPGTLQPVPDVMMYKDQLMEVNSLTARIHALSESIKVRGFYPKGAGNISDALEIAFKTMDDRKTLIPIADWAAFGGVAGKDLIVWLPIDMISEALKIIIELRKQVIDDVYQIMGLSDIMRGSTDAQETFGAQRLKSNYGSIRIRDKKEELVRIARDGTRIMCEIMAENFDMKTMLAMAQMEIPTNAETSKAIKEIEKKAKEVKDAVEKAMQDPQMVEQAQQNPDAAKQMVEQAERALEQLQKDAMKLDAKPTQEDILGFLRDERARPYAIDIETDSTVQADEERNKAQRNEVTQVLSALLPQISAMVEKMPESVELAGSFLKFVLAPYKASRLLDNPIDEFIENMQEKFANGGPQKSPEQIQMEGQAEIEGKRIELDSKKLDAQNQIAMAKIEAESDLELARLDNEKAIAEINNQAKMEGVRAQLAKIEADMKKMAVEQQFNMQKMDREDQQTQTEMMADQAIKQTEMEQVAQKSASDLRVAAAKERSLNAKARNDEIAGLFPAGAE